MAKLHMLGLKVKAMTHLVLPVFLSHVTTFFLFYFSHVQCFNDTLMPLVALYQWLPNPKISIYPLR